MKTIDKLTNFEIFKESIKVTNRYIYYPLVLFILYLGSRLFVQSLFGIEGDILFIFFSILSFVFSILFLTQLKAIYFKEEAQTQSTHLKTKINEIIIIVIVSSVIKKAYAYLELYVRSYLLHEVNISVMDISWVSMPFHLGKLVINELTYVLPIIFVIIYCPPIKKFLSRYFVYLRSVLKIVFIAIIVLFGLNVISMMLRFCVLFFLHKTTLSYSVVHLISQISMVINIYFSFPLIAFLVICSKRDYKVVE